MRIFVDVDGTLTDRQRGRSAFRDNPRQDVIDKVRRLQAAGHEIIIWSGNTTYARMAASHLGILGVVCVGKPDLWVDNEVQTWSRRIRRRIITPEDFLEREF